MKVNAASATRSCQSVTGSSIIINELFLLLIAGILLLLGVLKLLSPLNAPAMLTPDPVFSFLNSGTVLHFAGSLEVVIAGWVLSTRAKKQIPKYCLLSLMLSISIYRVGLLLLAPRATCHCGGLGWVGVRFINSVPGWVFTCVLAAGVFASFADMLHAGRRNRESNQALKLKMVRSLKHSIMLMLVVLASSPFSLNGQNQKLNASDGRLIGGTGIVEIAMPASGGTGDRIKYPIQLTLGADFLRSAVRLPDGSRQQWLISNETAMVATFSSSSVDKAGGVITNNSTNESVAAAVYPLGDSFPDIGPEALIWLAFYGAEHSLAGKYVKPPHFLATEPVGWLMDHSIEQNGQLAREIEFRFKSSTAGLDRAGRFLPRYFPHRRELLAKLEAGITRYTNGFLSGRYELESVTNIGERELPVSGKYQSYIPTMTKIDGVMTNRPGNHWSFAFSYSTNIISISNLAFDAPVDVQDSRARLNFGTEKAVFYKAHELKIIATNDPVFLDAMKSAPGMSDTEFTRLVRQLVVGSIIIIIALLPILVFSFRFRRSKHQPTTNS